MTVAAELREIARDYATHRDLLAQFVLRDVRIRYKQAAMGLLWALFLPLMLVGAGMLVRLAIASAAGTHLGSGAVGALAVSAVIWAGFSAAVSFGTGSLVSNSTLVSKIQFPREVLPVAAVLASAADTLVGLLLLACLLPWLGGVATPALLWVPLLLVLLLALTLALVLLLSAANLFFRDVKYLVQAMLTVGVLFTPVFYSRAEVGSRAAGWLAWNPLTPILEGVRLALFRGHGLAGRFVENGIVVWSPWMLVGAATTALVGLVLASLAFHRAEALFAERI